MPSEVVPAPKNLQFSEVTQNSFRVSWEHGAPDVSLYRLSWSKRGENDYQYVSVLIFNNIPAFVRQILIPLRALGLKKIWMETDAQPEISAQAVSVRVCLLRCLSETDVQQLDKRSLTLKYDAMMLNIWPNSRTLGPDLRPSRTEESR